jgi:hypothetical protein
MLLRPEDAFNLQRGEGELYIIILVTYEFFDDVAA